MQLISWTVPRFRHEELNSDRAEVRLVTVRHCLPGKPLECNIQHFNLQQIDPPQYAALSYAWGADSPSHRILLNGRRHEIRSNLYDFLKGVASLEEANEYRFWIDQLCIDQENKQEKNHQVRYMKKIFSTAREVIVWLGKAEGESQRAMNWVKYSAHRSTPFAGRDADSLLAFFDRAFWRRLWIVQEVVLAVKVVILCGNDYLTWLNLQRFYESRPKYILDGTVRDLFRDRSNAANVLASRPFYGPGLPHFPLLRALSTFCDHECQDLRDKVYGLLGIVLLDEQIAINYLQRVDDVFIDVVDRAIALNLEPDATQVEGSMARELARLGRSMQILSTDAQEIAWAHALTSFSIEAENLPDEGLQVPLYVRAQRDKKVGGRPQRRRQSLNLQIKTQTAGDPKAEKCNLRYAIATALQLQKASTDKSLILGSTVAILGAILATEAFVSVRSVA